MKDSLIEQIKWWVQDKDWTHRNGHFNFNHYCNVIQAKYENLYNNTLLPTEPESTEKENDFDC